MIVDLRELYLEIPHQTAITKDNAPISIDFIIFYRVVDAVFIEAPQSESELEQIPRALPNIPLLINVFKGGKTPMLPVERLENMGYRIAIYPSETQRAGIYAMRQALSLLKREGTTEAMDEALTTFKQRDTIVGLDDWQELERKFLSIDSGKN